MPVIRYKIKFNQGLPKLYEIENSKLNYLESNKFMVKNKDYVNKNESNSKIRNLLLINYKRSMKNKSVDMSFNDHLP